MSIRAMILWFIGGAVIVAAIVFGPEIVMPAACGLEAISEQEPLIVSFEGRRRDMVADIVFGGDKWPEVGYTSFVPINLEPGPPLNVAIATSADLLVSLAGATQRIRHVQGIEAGGHLAVHGVSSEKISFKRSRLCFARIASRAKASSSANVHAFVLTSDPPKDIPCFGLECAATPITWPRHISLPEVRSFAINEIVSSAPFRRPELLDGWAGFGQLIDRGFLRWPNPGEEEAALERVRAKYVSRFTPQWRPQFGIDFVMSHPTRLPRLDHETGAAFREATILVPEPIQLTEEGDHCLVAMGQLAPRNGYELTLRHIHQVPPYVISSRVTQKCLGDDQNPGPNRFEMADQTSPEPVPECQAVEAKSGEIVVGVYDYRNYRGRSLPILPLVDLRFSGRSSVVLVVRTADAMRRWRIAEAFPGQVSSLILAEPFYNRYDVVVDGLQPEQIVVDRRRLTEWRKRADGDRRPFGPYRPARLDQCDHRVSLMNWNPRFPGASISEKGFDRTVKVWTGRFIDILKYVDSEDPIVIDGEHPRN
jgi:hypothetical protein